MFTARNPRWWLRAAGAAGVCALTAALVANAPARQGRPRPAPRHGGADPRLDALALTIAAVASAALLVALRRPVSRGAVSRDAVSRDAVSRDAAVGVGHDACPRNDAAGAGAAPAESRTTTEVAATTANRAATEVAATATSRAATKVAGTATTRAPTATKATPR